MEFLLIGDIKLKVTLTPEDCREYQIDTSESDFSTAEMRAVVRDVLERARIECGFSAEGERILAQLYPMPDGSCELLVTKLKRRFANERNAYPDAEGLGSLESRRGAYRFPDLATLRAAAHALLRDGREYDAYMSETGECYISVSECNTDGISDIEAIIEYGDRIDSIPPYIFSERGRRIDINEYK